MTKINYKFTPIPNVMIYLLDGDCLLMYSTLWQKTQRFAQVNPSGWLSIPCKTLADLYGGSKFKMKRARSTLESYGLINIQTGHSGKVAPRYQVNLCAIKDLNNIPYEFWSDNNFRIFSGDDANDKPIPRLDNENNSQKQECLDEINLPF